MWGGRGELESRKNGRYFRSRDVALALCSLASFGPLKLCLLRFLSTLSFAARNKKKWKTNMRHKLVNKVINIFLLRFT